eukprot:TRINITY_DN37757_c0_g1_i1.p1 TRINITY_DN37757_c0_g1~~TRINITY_DN37757_c0_g1_i1.p1  ORF type:complete len:387 (-),score=72.52 TRINITY_DN37757_c0_g1_i1:72-1145(-)
MVVRFFVSSSVKGRNINFKLGKQFLQLGVKEVASPKLDGKLFAELNNVDDTMFEIEGSGPERCVTVTLDKKVSAMWPGMWEKATVESEEKSNIQQEAQTTTVLQGSFPAPVERGRERFGIHSFVFQRRRPFSAERLADFLRKFPVPQKEIFTMSELEPQETIDDTLKPVLRSKGFCWVDAEPLRQHVWAHAGKTLNVKAADWWWVALDEEQLKFKLTYPGVESEYKKIWREKWSLGVGDRRQEIVFIGGPHMQEKAIVRQLEACLLSDEELNAFNQRCNGLKVPNDDFHMNSLLKNLGATDDQKKEVEIVNNFICKENNDMIEKHGDGEVVDILPPLGIESELEQGVNDDLFFEKVD